MVEAATKNPEQKATTNIIWNWQYVEGETSLEGEWVTQQESSPK